MSGARAATPFALLAVVLLAAAAPTQARSVAVAQEWACGVSGDCAQPDGSMLMQTRARQGPVAAPTAGGVVVDIPGIFPKPKRDLRRGFASTGAAAPATCFVTSGKGCGLDTMGGPTLVYTGGDDARCLNGGEYAFLVTPGASDKLLFFFEGGGGCWRGLGGLTMLRCSLSVEEALESSGYGAGMQDFSGSRSAFKGHTVVEALYCSGDAFVGNTTLALPNGTVLQQNGYKQVSAALAWAKANMAPELQSLVMTGFSAGAIGVGAWADTILRTFSYAKAGVLLDSYAGLFAGGSGALLVRALGMCTTPLNMMGPACEAGKMDLMEALAAAMQAFPNVAFGSLQSKADNVQMLFYAGVALTFGFAGEANITPEQFYAGANNILARWSQLPNYFAYLVDGGAHTFIEQDSYFTASTEGPDVSGKPMLHEWVESLLLKQEGSAQCRGHVAPNNNLSTAFCDQRVVRNTVLLGEEVA